MGRTAVFKTRPSTYTIGHASTSRATCRVCKTAVGKGELRIMTHTFVRPGRSHNFVCHLKCATSALVKTMVRVHARCSMLILTYWSMRSGWELARSEVRQVV
mmetsp:Transcript_16114/g.41475  ORF Transcript_16114/g.41475 Transcript_16114/m.41475 type:complete len:102 (-) Transcript_16114:65-370(-)